MVKGIREDILFHNTVDLWISYCEAYNLEWNDINGYLAFIDHLKSLGIKMTPMNLCIKETGGLYERGKKKTDFLDKLSKAKVSKVVYTVKHDEKLRSILKEYFLRINEK